MARRYLLTPSGVTPGQFGDAVTVPQISVDALGRITSVASVPISATSVVDFKDSVRAATTANITLSGEQTIDGVACVTGNRVLVKNQSTGADNGIYVVASGAWTRATDFDANAEVTAGCVMPVSEGTVSQDTLYFLTTNDPITVGVTTLSFSILSVQSIGIRDFKAAVRVATTVAGTLATSFENGDTIDGITLATNDRILIKNQAAPAENGIYTVNASGAPTRATDFDADAEAIPGVVIPITEGTANGGTLWMMTTNGPITLGSTSLVFSKLGSGGGGGGGDSILKAAFGSRPAASNDGNLFLPTDGFTQQRDTGSIYEPWGPLFSLTKPPAAGDFTAVNQGSSTLTDVADALVLFAPADGGDNLRVYKKAAPATPYTITIGFIPTLLGVSFHSAGFVWRQSSDGKLIILSLEYSGNFLVRRSQYNSPTSFNAQTTFGEYIGSGMVFFQAADDGANRIFKFSNDGRNFITLETVGRTSFLTADEVGLYVATTNATYPAYSTILHWKQS